MALDIKGVSDTGMTVKLVSVADWCDIVNLNMYLILFFTLLVSRKYLKKTMD